MGGDHKCPVCQATFTRPQHVARHMRSHTGDRPYKCQYCGDQFARSDLLARHINKCHANEKPLANIGTRRKGSASASRATTSKQACDQCVQSSLPCDGCNPCSKCVQRKCRCTYVKFHRQTAPAGPGHNPHPASNSSNLTSSTASASGLVPLPSSSSSRLLSSFSNHPEDDFILGPPPPTSLGSSSHHHSHQLQHHGLGGLVPTSMAETLYASNTFAFPNLYPPTTTNSSSSTSASASSSTGMSSSTLMGVDATDLVADYTTKYRAQAQAELFGSTPTSSSAATSSGASGPGLGGRSGLGMYDPLPLRGTSSSTSASSAAAAAAAGNAPASNSSSSWMGWDSHQQPQSQQEINDVYGRHHGGGPMHDKYHPHQQQHQQQQYMSISMPFSVPSSYLPTSTTTNENNSNNTRRSESVDAIDFGHTGDRHTHAQGHHGSHAPGQGQNDNFSDGASSANSSNVHLPLGGYMVPSHSQGGGGAQGGGEQGMYGYNFALGIPDRAATASTSTNSSSSSHHHRGDSAGSYVGYATASDERQEFSSAFGLMSLDDPNVLAGLAADGQPFFSDPGQAHNHGHDDDDHPGADGERGSRGDGSERNESGALLGGDMDTPMPIKQSSGLLSAGLHLSGMGGLPARVVGSGNGLQTPSREMDSREMKEFWKQYMRTPLTGPTSGLGDPITTSSGSSQANKGSSTSTATPYRRQRVSSLPSVKTPVLEYDDMYGEDQYYYHQQHQYQQQQQQHRGDGQHGKLGPMSSIRTTLHGNPEDLRSYEAAVLARKAPALMNLQLKRPMKSKAELTSSKSNTKPKSTAGPQSQQSQASPTPSSLANAFGSFPTKKEQSASPSLSSANTTHSRGSPSQEESDADSNRPSFKRLPSQTLGPANAKKAFYGYDDDIDTKNREMVGWGAGAPDIRAPSTSTSDAPGGPKIGADAPKNPRAVLGVERGGAISLADRRKRRMSAPGASLNLQSLPSPLPSSVVKLGDSNNANKPAGGGAPA